MNQSAQDFQDSSFFGHPRGLMTLFLTEMWGKDVILWNARTASTFYDEGSSRRGFKF